jgi:hypothetical protein
MSLSSGDWMLEYGVGVAMVKRGKKVRHVNGKWKATKPGSKVV